MDHAVRDRLRRDPESAKMSRPWWFSDWTHGLYAELREPASQYVTANSVKLHTHAPAVHSSMAFAFNVFFPFRLWSPRPLERVLSTVLRRNLTVEAVEFEFCDLTDLLGEWRGERRDADDKATTSDVAITVRDEVGQRGVVLVEVKCAEEHFTACNGIDSAGNRRRDVCASAAMFFKEPRRCYLTHTYRATKDRLYWEIFERAFGSLGMAFPGVEGGCPFAGDNQQPMRNHALALALVQAGRFDFAYFGLVHHDRNPDIPPRWAAYTKLCADTSLLFDFRATDLLVAAEGAGPSFDEWQAYVRDRYGLRAGQRGADGSGRNLEV